MGGSMARLVHCKAALLLQTDVRQSATRAGIWRAQQCLQVGLWWVVWLGRAQGFTCGGWACCGCWAGCVSDQSLQACQLVLCVLWLQEWERLRALGMTAALGEDDSLDLQASCLPQHSHTHTAHACFLVKLCPPQSLGEDELLDLQVPTAVPGHERCCVASLSVLRSMAWAATCASSMHCSPQLAFSRMFAVPGRLGSFCRFRPAAARGAAGKWRSAWFCVQHMVSGPELRGVWS